MNARIRNLTMEQFKCFKKLQVQFGALTVLCGLNGAGKSTVVQPILLLAQSLKRQQNSLELLEKNWDLNGELIRLGSSGDVLFEFASNNELNFEFVLSNDSRINFDFHAENSMPSLKYMTHKTLNISQSSLDSIANLSYIGAAREVALESFPFPDESENVEVGVDGRFASFWYNEMADRKIEKSICWPEETSRVFRVQMDAWLNRLVPGARVSVRAMEDISAVALKFKLSELGSWKKPVNVGYGLAYVFPVLVALLCAKPNDLLIIDSPEAHLHPQAQSRLGQMISIFASTGVQIVVETHSDHILNGICLGVKKGKLEPQDLSILFFSGCTEDSHGVISPAIDKSGRTSDWPKGFFDQMELDLMEIFGG